MTGPGSEEQLEVARRLIEAFNRNSVEEARDVCDPDVELLTLFGRVRGVHQDGHRGLAEWFGHIAEAWAFFEARITRAEVRGEWVVAGGRSRGRGKASHAEVEFEWTAVLRVTGGKVRRLGIYLNRDEALEAISQRDLDGQRGA